MLKSSINLQSALQYEGAEVVHKEDESGGVGSDDASDDSPTFYGRNSALTESRLCAAFSVNPATQKNSPRFLARAFHHAPWVSILFRSEEMQGRRGC